MTALVVALELAVLASSSQAGTATLTEEVDALVRDNFYSPARLAEVDWGALPQPQPGEDEVAAVRRKLALLRASHTALYTRDDPEYSALLSIFEANLDSLCKGSPPPRPIRIDSIGAHWKRLDSSWFVSSLIPGSEAERAGLLVGDEIASADGRDFGPVTAFRGKSGTSVALGVRRSRHSAVRSIEVKPSSVGPREEFADSITKGSRLIATPKHRVGYVPIFSWAGEDLQGAVLNAIVELNRQHADSWVVDLRDGFGGANPEYASIFAQDVVDLRLVDRAGKEERTDTQLRGPIVLLINGGTRSGKELIAYGAKKARVATLLGTRTAGAVLAGRPFCLSDGSLLYLAVKDVFVDGERLEGLGVAPDVEVPFDLQFAAGKDAQLAAALRYLGAR